MGCEEVGSGVNLSWSACVYSIESVDEKTEQGRGRARPSH